MSFLTSIYTSFSRTFLHACGRGTFVPQCALVAVLLLAAGCAQSSDLTSDGDLTIGTIESGSVNARLPESGRLDIATSVPDASPGEGSDDAAIRLAVDRLYGLRVACGRDPARCNVGALAVPGSPYRSALTELMALRVRHGLRTVAGHGVLRWRVESVSRTGADRAVVHTCATDSLVVFDAAGGEPGFVFDDSVVSTRTEWVIVRHNGAWKWSEEHILAQRRGGGVCGGF
jgi:hypothetical protein